MKNEDEQIEKPIEEKPIEVVKEEENEENQFEGHPDPPD